LSIYCVFSFLTKEDAGVASIDGKQAEKGALK